MCYYRPVHDFWLALSFLTTLPAPQLPFKEGALGRASAWFPLVGLLLGGGMVGLAALGLLHLPPLFLAAALVALWALLTGGLHLDGFADCCDGLLPPLPPARRLPIMRDPHAGAFAVIGLVLLLLLKVTALAALLAQARWLPALLLAPTLARWLLLWAARQPAARPDGLAASFQVGLSGRRLALAGLLPAGLLLWQGWSALFALLLASLTTLAWRRLAQRRLGGVTGDVLGAIVETAELAILVAFLL